MFEKLMKELKNLEGEQKISISIEADEKGYTDKQCPAENCLFLFKVNAEDWKNIFQDEAVWCPLCGHKAPANHWYTTEQIEHGKRESLAVVQGKVGNAMKSDADRFNRSQPKNSFLSMSMEVKDSKRRTHPLPIPATKPMQFEIQCEKCNSRFAVNDTVSFCPSCGDGKRLRNIP